MNRVSKRGFTIVELLIVIVVLGILVTITVVAFNGVNRQATTAGLKADLKSSANKLLVYKVDANDRYPATLEDAGVSNSETVTYVYTYTSGTNEFCMTGFPSSDLAVPHYVDTTSAGVPQEGTCSGHVDPSAVLTMTWTQRTSLGTGNWRAVAISGDGQYLLAVTTGNSYIRYSVDGGVTWSTLTSAGYRSWTSVAISDDGQTIVGVTSSSTPVISTNGGSTWLTPAAAGNRNWQAVTVSSDGSHIAASATGSPGGYVHTSTDYGVTWTQRTAVGQSGWQSIDSSADGQHIIVLSGSGGSSGYIRYSSNIGASWASAPYPTQGWWGAAISDDGQRMVAGPTGTAGPLRQTLDGGSTWRSLDTPSTEWRGVDSSRDGEVIVAVNRGNGQVLYSTDAGDTWTYEPIITSTMRYAACSADCREIVIADSTTGYVYTGILAPAN